MTFKDFVESKKQHLLDNAFHGNYDRLWVTYNHNNSESIDGYLFVECRTVEPKWNGDFFSIDTYDIAEDSLLCFNGVKLDDNNMDNWKNLKVLIERDKV